MLNRTQLELANSKLQEKVKYLEDARNELRDLQQKENAYEKFKFNNKNKKYNEMIKWGYANDCEKKYKMIKSQREEKASEIEDLQNDLDGWKGSLEGLIRKNRELEIKNNEIKDRAQEKEESLKILKDKISAISEKKHQLEIRFKEVTEKQGN